MVLNLKDKDGTRSGKGFNWSWYGLRDGEKDSKNAEVFRRIAENMDDTTTAGDALNKELDNLTTSGQKLGNELVNSGKELPVIKQGFLNAAKAAEKTSLGARAAAAGMKILSVAGNMLFSIGIGIALNLITEGISAIANAQQNAIDKSNELIGAWKEQRDTLESNKKSIDTISGEQNKSIVHIQLDWLDMESAFTLYLFYFMKGMICFDYLKLTPTIITFVCFTHVSCRKDTKH